MLRLSVPLQLRETCDARRREGRRVGLVPTMGFLHDGHLSLVQRARALADFVVLTIFVNPAQFGPGEDLQRYPRDTDGDLDKCLRAEVDCVFVPEREAIYPAGYQTFVDVEHVSQGMCGAARPGHFRGVATVVAKLFNMVGPCVAVFGEKDYQQLQVLRRMALDLDLPVEVVGSPIVREPDGLAMSSRNAYLDPSERRQATCLHRSLEQVGARVAMGEVTDADQVTRMVRELVEAEPAARVDYVEVRDAHTLEPVSRLQPGRTLVAMAVFLGQTRLIDNRVV